MKFRRHACSFCGKGAKQVGPLVEGSSGALICGDCIELCQVIIEQERRRRDSPVQKDHAGVRAALDVLVDGQATAKEALVGAALAHYAPQSGPSQPLLLVGPSPSSKLYLSRALAHILDVPLVELNADELRAETEANSPPRSRFVFRLLEKVCFDVEAARSSMVFVDAAEQPSVQDALLERWDSTPSHLGGDLHDLHIDAGSLLFLCAGDFAGIDTLRGPVGNQQLIEMGVTARFARRFGAIIGVEPLCEASLVQLARTATLSDSTLNR